MEKYSLPAKIFAIAIFTLIGIFDIWLSMALFAAASRCGFFSIDACRVSFLYSTFFAQRKTSPNTPPLQIAQQIQPEATGALLAEKEL